MDHQLIGNGEAGVGGFQLLRLRKEKGKARIHALLCPVTSGNILSEGRQRGKGPRRPHQWLTGRPCLGCMMLLS